MKVTDPRTGKVYFRKRRRRFDEVGSARELTFSCYRGYRFLERDRVRSWFIEALANARQKCAFDLWAYVVMPEHVHVLICPRKSASSVSEFLRQLKEPVARQAIDYLKQRSPVWLAKLRVREGRIVRHRFWQPGGGYDRNLVELATVHRAIEYIHMNPVRRGLVGRPEDWAWSSAGWYRGLRPAPIEMDCTVPMDVVTRT